MPRDFDNPPVTQILPVLPDFWLATSNAAHELRATIDRVAPTNATVLIVGESGTGKEVAAHALHDASHRRGSFVPVNMAAVPHELAESHLFGHQRGAFTGANAAYCGYCEAAHDGTLFLDEVTEMEFGLQAKLLRFLEDQTVQRVGSTTRVSLTYESSVILRIASGRSDTASSSAPAAGLERHGALVRLEHQVILDELVKCHGSVQQAARSLGIPRSTLYRKLKHIRRLL